MDSNLKDKIHEMSQKIITDQEFADLLRKVVNQNIRYTEDKPIEGMPFELNVFTRHNFGDKLSLTVIVAELPEPGTPFDRYQLMQVLGAKYYLEMIHKKPRGEKCYPLVTFLNSEAWVRGVLPKGKNMEKFKTNGVIDFSKLPLGQRQEVVTTAGMTMDKRNNQAMMNINRTKNNKIMLSNPVYIDYGEKNSRSESPLLTNFYVGFMKAMYIEQKKVETELKEGV